MDFRSNDLDRSDPQTRARALRPSAPRVIHAPEDTPTALAARSSVVVVVGFVVVGVRRATIGGNGIQVSIIIIIASGDDADGVATATAMGERWESDDDGCDAMRGRGRRMRRRWGCFLDAGRIFRGDSKGE